MAENIATGIVGSVQFDGYGPKSGEAQIVIHRGDPLRERRFLLTVLKTTPAAFDYLRLAVETMWDAVPVNITWIATANLPAILSIERA